MNTKLLQKLCCQLHMYSLPKSVRIFGHLYFQAIYLGNFSHYAVLVHYMGTLIKIFTLTTSFSIGQRHVVLHHFHANSEALLN